MFLGLAVIAACMSIEQAARIFFLSIHDQASKFLTLSYNAGAAFGLLSDLPDLILILSGLSCALLVIVSLFADMKVKTRLGLSMMSGGALSNFLERCFLGHVIDWIPSPLPCFEINFNLADVEISLGAFIMLYLYIEKESF